jgi:hypothetical protein
MIYFGTLTFGSFEHSKSFFLRSTLYPELQIEHHTSLVIDDCDLLRDFNVQEFRTLQSLFPPKYSVPGVTDRAPRVFPDQRRYLSFAPLRVTCGQCSHVLSSGVPILQSEDLTPRVLFQWTVQMNSGSPAFESSCSTHSLFSQSNFPLKWQIFCHVSLPTDEWDDFGLWPSEILVPSHFDFPGVTSLGVQDLTTPVPLAWMAQICFGSWLFGSFAMQTPLFSRSRSVSG